MEMMKSKLTLYSLGIVLETKKRSSWIIKVYPVEEIPLRDGELNVDTVIKQKFEDIRDDTREYQVMESNSIYARWIPAINSNRATPPDVCVNETVLIFKYADSDEFFWTALGYEPALRKQETVTYVYSNVKEFEEEVNKKNSYWFTISTHDKYIRLHTSDNDGEFTVYDIVIDTKKGAISIVDGVGNKLVFSSKEGKLYGKINKGIILSAPEIILDGNVTVTGNTTVSKDTNIGNNLTVGNTGVIPTVVCNNCTCC